MQAKRFCLVAAVISLIGTAGCNPVNHSPDGPHTTSNAASFGGGVVTEHAGVRGAAPGNPAASLVGGTAPGGPALGTTPTLGKASLWTSMRVEQQEGVAFLRLSAIDNARPGQSNGYASQPIDASTAGTVAHAGTHNIVIPLGWTLNVTLVNSKNVQHSALVLPYDASLRSGKLPSFAFGRGSNGAVQNFTWKGRTPGQYAIVCTEHRHGGEVLATFTVSPSATQPTITGPNTGP